MYLNKKSTAQIPLETWLHVSQRANQNRTKTAESMQCQWTEKIDFNVERANNGMKPPLLCCVITKCYSL